MDRAIALARRGEGLTRPNPPVGAVIVKGGRIIGEGWHRRAGGPHAEVVALRQAGSAARGATLFVTLEPCSTYGRTPPCTGAVLSAGIKRVVVACKDPNPKHAGRGLRLLGRSGVEVLAGVGGEEASRLIGPFAMWITKRRPFITLKLAVALDGKIADARGRSQWITGEAARKRVHDLRRRADAIMVGVNTVNADNPSLLPRPARGRAPWRVILDTHGRINPDAKVLSGGQAILATCDRPAAALVPDSLLYDPKKGRVPLPRLMRELASRYNVMHLVCEGGGGLAASLIREKLVDELWMFIAPKIIGGSGGTPAFGGEGWPLALAPELRIVACERVGDDVLLMARRK